MESNIQEIIPPNPPTKSARKKQMAKERDAKLKENHRDEWERRRDLRNEKRRERRQKAKEENPDEYQEKVSKESVKRQERRIHFKNEFPEEHAAFLTSEKEKRKQVKIKTWNDLFDSLFHENKHTFPTPVSPKLWEKLKKTEIDFLLSDTFAPGEITTNYLLSYRKGQFDFLKNNPKFPHGGSVIFYIKTMVHRPRDQRIINAEELDYINSLILPDLEMNDDKIFRRHCYYEKNRNREIELAKTSYEKKKSVRITDNLNVRFIKADPNKVLSLDDICNNPFMTNFSDREEFKVNLWKHLNEDEKPEFLEKWKKQREIYEKEVEDLSEEYKENFLKQMEGRDYFDEWEKRKEKYLDHFRNKWPAQS